MQYWNQLAQGRDRIVVSTSRCGRDNPGSNPGHGRAVSLALIRHCQLVLIRVLHIYKKRIINRNSKFDLTFKLQTVHTLRNLVAHHRELTNWLVIVTILLAYWKMVNFECCISYYFHRTQSTDKRGFQFIWLTSLAQDGHVSFWHMSFEFYVF